MLYLSIYFCIDLLGTVAEQPIKEPTLINPPVTTEKITSTEISQPTSQVTEPQTDTFTSVLSQPRTESLVIDTPTTTKNNIKDIETTGIGIHQTTVSEQSTRMLLPQSHPTDTSSGNVPQTHPVGTLPQTHPAGTLLQTQGTHSLMQTQITNPLDHTVPPANSSLPVAAIDINMINGQPVYTIQLMGHSIPLAAITIPTSEGPLQLQSATSCITTQSLNKPDDGILSSDNNVQFSDTDTASMEPSSPGSPSSS